MVEVAEAWTSEWTGMFWVFLVILYGWSFTHNHGGTGLEKQAGATSWGSLKAILQRLKGFETEIINFFFFPRSQKDESKEDEMSMDKIMQS